MFLKRSVSSAILIVAVLCVIYLVPKWMYALVVICFIGQGLNEFYTIVGNGKKIHLYRISGIILGCAVPLIIYLQHGYGQEAFEPFLIVIVSLSIFVKQFMRKDNDRALAAISISLLAILYISWFFSFFIKIRILNGGADYVLVLLLIAKSGDVGSYLIGKNFGIHSLIKHISPNKTIEGTLGGLLFSVIVALLCKNILPHIATIHFLFLGLLIGVLSQIGDLSESLIKRDCGVKDSSMIFPGLGGVLDIIDSLLFTAPIYYFYIKGFVLS